MTERIWDQLLTQQGKTVFAQVGVNQQSGVIRRHALLVMDANYNFTGNKPHPIFETSKLLKPVIRTLRYRVDRYAQGRFFKPYIDPPQEIVIDSLVRYQGASTLHNLAR